VLVSAARRNNLSLKNRVLIRSIRLIRGWSKILKFPRTLAPFFLQYMSERPEMTSSKREIKEGHNKKRRLGYEKPDKQS
jgi:hypothetical protein